MVTGNYGFLPIKFYGFCTDFYGLVRVLYGSQFSGFFYGQLMAFYGHFTGCSRIFSFYGLKFAKTHHILLESYDLVS